MPRNEVFGIFKQKKRNNVYHQGLADTCPCPSTSSFSEFGDSINPKPFPHIIFRFDLLWPSPNSSFHFLSSAKVPRDSEEEGVISFRAFVKWRLHKTRGVGESSTLGMALALRSPPWTLSVPLDNGTGCDCVRFNSEFSPSVLIELGVSDSFSFGTVQGRITPSLTASKAAETQRSIICYK